MDALKRKMEIAAVAFFCTVTALIAACSCATTAAANLAQQTAAAPATEYVTLAYMEVQPEAEQEPELLYDVPMSDELQRYIREQAERQDVPFEIALAVIERESSYQPDAVSDTGDFGLMQINICNHRWLYEELGITDVMDPEQNIEAGLYILGQAFQKYDDPDKALMAYNMGDSGMKSAWSKGQHSSKYSRAVIETAQALKRKDIKFFASTDEDAYASAAAALNAICAARLLVPLIDEAGAAVGGGVRLKDPGGVKRLDTGTAQLALHWDSRRPYNRVDCQKVMHYNLDLKAAEEKTE